MKKAYILICLLAVHCSAIAQFVGKGDVYSLQKLSQEAVSVTSLPEVAGFEEASDTSYTIYKNCSVPVKTYFVNGAQYDNIFNPNPTGLYINGQHFVYYCGIEMSIRQNYSNVLDIKEFVFLGKSYLMIINFREDCHGDNCRYRCYNVFDISDPDKVTQVSFSSIYEGIASFGEFNSDGVIDFVRVAPKPSGEESAGGMENYLLTAYTIPRKLAKQLTNQKGHAYYLYVQGDEEAKQFEVLQADWFFPMKDTTGNIAPAKSYFAPYISFDPLYRYLYSPEGVRIEKNRWSVYVSDYGDLEAAQEYCRRVKGDRLGEPYIMIDQYSGDIKFQVFVGNYVNREAAKQSQELLISKGIAGTLKDLRQSY